MNSTNWKSQLNSLISDNPELQLPEEEIAQAAEKTFRKQSLYIELDKKGRNGKQATLISGFDGTAEELKKLAAELKKVCGVGGSTRDDEILIQGDFREKITALLTSRGHKVKRKN